MKKTHGFWVNYGKSRTKEFIAWGHMIERCQVKSCRSYHRYGGRGISVCERWKGEGGYFRFLEDVGVAPSPKHSLDRINNDGNYEPGNVRWATSKEQSENKDSTRFLEYNGERLTASEWSRRTGFSVGAIRARLEDGWPVDKILTIPVRGKRKNRMPSTP